ncbi:MAG: DNA translocase FtsK 4TM domain-containing protein, partial [Sandarakinorhabdus sp.]|nr:DNA translocase FtsK 4TM domain-containing protein [Sandarakinorhabdus sp.]
MARVVAAIKAAVVRFGVLLFAAALIGAGVALAVALLSYSPLDPSFNTVTGRAATNWLGSIGSHVADVLLQLLGWPALAL